MLSMQTCVYSLYIKYGFTNSLFIFRESKRGAILPKAVLMNKIESPLVDHFKMGTKTFSDCAMKGLPTKHGWNLVIFLCFNYKWLFYKGIMNKSSYATILMNENLYFLL